MRIKKRLLAAAGTLAVAGGTLIGVAPNAHADVSLGQNLVTCNSGVTISSLNPAIGSGDAKYVKAANKRSDGTLSYDILVGGGTIPADNLTCLVDAGIRTNDTSTDVGTKLNPFDDQTNGQSVLNMTGPGPFTGLGKVTGVVSGSSSCQRADLSVNVDYPKAYPLQGKLIWKFAQADALLKQIQIQQYIRLGTDPTETNPQNITIKGIAIKGPGVGGESNAVVKFSPVASTKNVNIIDCFTTPAAQNGSLALVAIEGADGTDGDALVDNWTISIPS